MTRARASPLQSVYDRLPVGFAHFGADLRLAAWNARFAAICDYPRKLLRSGSPLESFLRIDAERGEYGLGPVDALVRQQLAALKRRRRTEREPVRPDGRILRIASERLADGGLLVTCEDVSEARRAEERLRLSEERYDVAMRAINEGLYDWDIVNDTVHYSDRVYQAVGLSADDYTTAAGWFERIHPDDQARYRDATRAHLRGETDRFECDYRYRWRDGSWHWARQHGLAVRDASGRAVRLVGSTGDITELKERERELAEHVAEQTAVRDLLEAISRSAFDLDAVLRTLIESAARLCHAERAFIFRRDGDAYRLAVDYGGVTPEFREFIAQHPIRPGRDTLVGRTALTKAVVHIEDVLADPEYRWPQSQRMGGQRSMLGVPIVRDDAVVGVIALWKERVEPFTPAQIQLVATFSSQAAIAIENARLFGETREALAQQTAISEILQVVARSPTELQPVLDAVVARAAQLCEARDAHILQVRGDALFVTASHGEFPITSQSEPVPIRWGLVSGRAVLGRELVHVPDIASAEARAEFPESARYQQRFGDRTVIGVPLLREGSPIGLILIRRREMRPFTDKQIVLLKTFADQAVIAIENVRLFNETKEALERQTATAEILKVIASSPSDEQPVFDAIIAHAGRIAGGCSVNVSRLVGDELHLAAYTRISPEADDFLERCYPISVTEVRPLAEAVHRKAPFFVGDFETDPDVSPKARELMRTRGFRSTLYVPIRRGDVVYGVMHVSKAEPGPFPDHWVSILGTFADQAVIAIENVRLFQELEARNRELSGALDREKATAEILKVISSSPTDVQPVFDAVAERAAKLCDSPYANVPLVEGDQLQVMSYYSTETGPKPDRRNFVPISRAFLNGRAVIDRAIVHVADVLPLLDTEYPEVRRNQEKFGFRAVLVIPLMREGRAIGTIFLWRREPQLFPAEQVALLQTFADQAVIAIENVRLFNELQARNRDLTESLEQQTATAEILRVISSSPTDIAPVLDAVAENAARLCEANDVVVMMNEGDVLRAVKSSGPFGAKFGADFTIPITRGSAAGRAVIERATVQVADFESASDEEFPVGREHRRIYGNHGAMATPLLHGDAVLGVIAVLRREVRPFSDRQRALLRTFADQAAIAIANVRLFNETKEALEQQRATADVLSSISGSLTDTQPVFERIVRNVRQLFGTRFAVLQILRGDVVEMPAVDGDPGFERLRDRYPRPLDDTTVGGRAMLLKKTVQFAPVLDNPETPLATVQFAKDFGFNSVIFTPMIHEGEVIGAIGAAYPEAKGFDERYVGLIRTFADQAVIAIENVRLFNETKEALEKQTAISEILRVISASPTDVQPVFDAIVRSAVTLCGSKDGAVFRYDGERLHYAAGFDQTPEWVDAVQSRYPMHPETSTIAGRAILGLSVVQIDDVLADPAYDHERAIKGGWRRMLAVPMLREGVPLGVIVVSWPQPGPTPKSQEDLLRTFADQAVIAIENVRLFNETKEALDHQRASAEVLQVISSSVADTTPVFDKILSSCERLFEGTNVGINLVGEDGALYLGAYHGAGRDALQRHFPLPVDEGSGSGVAILQRRVVHYPDVEAAGVPDFARRGSRIAGNRSVLFAPMLWEGRGIGAIWVGRGTVGEFSEKEIALLRTFADQAVIAIQNAKLFREIQEKSHQLEIANQHKSAFLANMSHELRTPLNAVIGFSEMLAARYFGDLTEKQAEYVNDIHGSGKHLLSLINDILDLSKIEAGRMELEAVEFDLRAALENAITLVRERAQRGGVALRLDTGPDLGAFRGDERKLKQVVLNLLSNAVKFTPRGGAVDVSARRADGAVEIAVRDTGAGIAPGDHEAIFEAFRQVGTDATRKREGTGLGLALTRRFVELHGGTIRVESAVGKGSTFTVRLPTRHGE